MWFGVSHTQLTVLNGCLDPLQIISCLLKVTMNSNTTDQERLLPHPEEIKEKTYENTLQNCISSSNMVNAYNAVNLMRIKLNFKACPFWMASEISREVQKYFLVAGAASLILLDMTYWGSSHCDFQSLVGLQATHSYILSILEWDFQVFKCMCCEGVRWIGHWWNFKKAERKWKTQV